MSESKLQQTCVKWWAYAAHAKGIDRRFLVAIPNGGKRDARTGALMKKEGAVAGMADLVLFHPWDDTRPLFIEMKLPKGRQSESQIEFEKLFKAAGYSYVICRTFEEFRVAVESYLGITF